MKILVGYDGGEVGRLALSLARDMAGIRLAFVYVVTSMAGGASERQEDIERAETGLDFAKSFLENSGIQCDVQQSVRGLSPGEDLVKFAKEKPLANVNDVNLDNLIDFVKVTHEIKEEVMDESANDKAIENKSIAEKSKT